VQVALTFLKRGWRPIPVPFRSKIPLGSKWQTLTIDTASAPRHFNGDPQNVGVLLGPASNGLTDVDLDCAEAIAVAPYLLPKTGAMFGRKSKRASHWLYCVTAWGDADMPAALRFKAPDKTTICELRIGGNGGAQTVFPGSTHESGELIAWEPDCDGEPAQIDGDALLKLVQRIAAAAVLARHWPQTNSHSRDD